MTGWLLRDRGIGIPDHALGPFVHPKQHQHARIVAETAVEEALGDGVAWALIVGDTATRTVREKDKDVVVLSGPLLSFQVAYGNKGRKR